MWGSPHCDFAHHKGQRYCRGNQCRSSQAMPVTSLPVLHCDNGITLERDGRMVPLHPDVERVMQKEIRQDRAYHPTLWRSSLPLDEAPILHLYGCLQPTFDVQKHPWAIPVFADRAHQQLGINDRRSSGYRDPEPTHNAVGVARQRCWRFGRRQWEYPMAASLLAHLL
jgi:hypothetical protein